MNNYYIYLHLRLNDGKVFYVGKGKGRRAFDKRNRNPYWENVVNKYGYDVMIIEDNLINEDALTREIYWIKRIGRKNLVNMTDGGEGSEGFKHSPEAIQKLKDREPRFGKDNGNYGGGNWSVEAKNKFSEYQKINMLGDKNPFYGKKHSNETKKHLSIVRSGRKLTDEHKKNISLAQIGKRRNNNDLSGENNPNSKLTYEIANEIRERYSKGNITYKEIALEYNINKGYVGYIINYKVWK